MSLIPTTPEVELGGPGFPAGPSQKKKKVNETLS
jgi:hypothetical protein